MKTLMKLIAGLIALVIVLIVAGGAILGIFFDPNQYKAEIEKLALEKGGVELKIGGDIGWSVFPWLGLEVNSISVRYPDKPQLATLTKAELAVRIPALLSGQLEMSSVVVDGLKLNLVQEKDLSNNWTAPTATTAPKPSEQTGGGAAPIALDVQSVELTNSDLNFEDRKTGARYLVKNLNLVTGAVANDTFFPVDLGLTLEQYSAGSQSAALTADAKLTADLRFDLTKQLYWVRALDSTLGVQGGATGGKRIELKLGGEITADPNQQKVSLDNLKLGLANLAASGSIAVDNFAAPVIAGNLNVAPFDLNKLLTALGQPAVETSDPNVLKAVALSTQLGGPANTVTARELSLKLDDTTFKGSAGFDIASSNITLNLQGDAINADRYLPPAKEAPAAQPAKTAAGGERYSKDPIIPVEPLQPLNADISLKLGKLLVSKIDVANLDLVVNAHNGLVKVPRLNAELYQGSVRSSVTLDARKLPVQLAVQEEISGIQVGSVLKSMANSDALTGAFSSQANITARGQSVYDIVHSLNGTAAIQMKDGEIKGIDMAQTVCQGLNTVASLGINTQQVDRSTPFANLNASTTIVNGVVNNPDLSAALDAMQLNGRGKVDLPAAMLDYRLGFTIKENLFKQTCSIPNSLEGVELPVDCKGSFDDKPTKLCRPDLSAFTNVFKAQAKAKVKEKVDEKLEVQKEKLKEKLGGSLEEKLGGEEGAKKLLKGLFSQ